MKARNERREELSRAAAVKQEETEIALVSRYIDEFFNENELGNLAFDMGVKYENLPGVAKDRKGRELVDYMRRHGRLYALVEMCREKRPHVPWPFVSVDIAED